MARRVNNFQYITAPSEVLTASTGKRRRQPSPSRGLEQQHRTVSKAKTCQIYQHNLQSSPILRLPAEIRNTIFEFALGNKIIHVSVRKCHWNDTGARPYSDYYTLEEPPYQGKRKAEEAEEASKSNSYLRLTHSICSLSLDAEDEAYERNRRIDVNLSDDAATLSGEEPYHARHAKCYATLAALKKDWSSRLHPSSDAHATHIVSKLPVALLRTCRQIYKESRHLLYSTNTFAFHEGYSLNFFFTKVLTASQTYQVRSIQTDGWLTYSEQPYTIPDQTVQMLKGLVSLQTWIPYGPSYYSTVHHWGTLNHAPRSRHHEVSWSISPFTELNLSTVKVIVGPCPLVSRASSAKERKQAAEEIEEKMSRNNSCHE